MKIVKYSVALMMTKAEKILFSLFLAICVVVHILGLQRPYTAEPAWSHLLHIVSYAVCLWMLLINFTRRKISFFLGAVYPMYYHIGCLLHSSDMPSIIICSLVVLLLPLMWWRLRANIQ